MTSGHLPPEQWAEAAAEWGPEFFRIRVTQETDEEHLREAVKYEAENKARQERIAFLNKRIAKL